MLKERGVGGEDFGVSKFMCEVPVSVSHMTQEPASLLFSSEVIVIRSRRTKTKR